MESAGADAGGAAGPAGPPVHHRRLVALVALGVLAADQLTKAWVVATREGSPLHVIGDVVEIRLTRNTGSAFSLFRAFTPVLAVVALGAAVVLWRMTRRTADTWTVLGLSLVLGGALGNLVDRVARDPGFLRGAVVDFVRVWRWPVFNVADAAITIGAVLLALRALRHDGREG